MKLYAPFIREATLRVTMTLRSEGHGGDPSGLLHLGMALNPCFCCCCCDVRCNIRFLFCMHNISPRSMKRCAWWVLVQSNRSAREGTVYAMANDADRVKQMRTSTEQRRVTVVRVEVETQENGNI